PIDLMFRPPVFNPDVLAIDIADLFQPLTKTPQKFGGHVKRSRVKPPDNRHPSRLRACGDRPCRRRTAEQRDELAAAAHSITSLARASSAVGTSRPRLFAVLRLIASSYFVGVWTGRSAAFSPLRMRST